MRGSRFLLFGGLNSFYLVEYSADLNLWLPLATNRFTGLPLEIVDHSATNARTRFTGHGRRQPKRIAHGRSEQQAGQSLIPILL